MYSGILNTICSEIYLFIRKTYLTLTALKNEILVINENGKSFYH